MPSTVLWQRRRLYGVMIDGADQDQGDIYNEIELLSVVRHRVLLLRMDASEVPP